MKSKNQVAFIQYNLLQFSAKLFNKNKNVQLSILNRVIHILTLVYEIRDFGKRNIF